MKHDVFISYSSKNKDVADELCQKLEAQHFQCWIAPRNIPPAETYAKQISSAIEGCKVFVILFSKDSATSKWCLSEVDYAVHENKIMIPIRIDDYPLQKEMRLYLGSKQWIKAFPEPQKHFKAISNSIQEIIDYEVRDRFVAALPETNRGSAAPSAGTESAGPGPDTVKNRKRYAWFALVPESY